MRTDPASVRQEAWCGIRTGKKIRNELPISVAAILDAVYADGIGVGVGKTDPEVADAEAVLRRIDALQLLDVPRVGEDKALDGGRRYASGSHGRALPDRPAPGP